MYLSIIFILNLYVLSTLSREILIRKRSEFGLVHDPYRLCYYTTWARYRRPPGDMQPHDAPSELCSHLIMAFGWISPEGRLRLHSEWEDQYVIRGLIGRKLVNPNLKVLIAIGGQNFGSEAFRRLIATDETRRTFVNSTLEFMGKWGLDGIDINWEYPLWTDRENFTRLLRELDDAFVNSMLEKDGEKPLLTLAVPGIRERLIGFDLAALMEYVDIFNLMAYNFNGPWRNKTGHNAPINSYDSLNLIEAAKVLTELGLPRHKVAIGLPTYGHSFHLASPSDTSVGSPAITEQPASYTRTPGVYAYYEICEFVRGEGAVVAWDYQAEVPFAYKGRTWISFDDTFSVRKKAQWALSEGYAGVMIWELGMDDFSGHLCSDKSKESQVSFPLLRAINRALGVKMDETRSDHSGDVVFERTQRFEQGSMGRKEGQEDGENVKVDNQCDHDTPRKKDCGRFFVCSRGIQYEFECPDGTLFSADRAECVWPYEAPECNQAKNSTSPVHVATATKSPNISGTVKTATKSRTNYASAGTTRSAVKIFISGTGFATSTKAPSINGSVRERVKGSMSLSEGRTDSEG